MHNAKLCLYLDLIILDQEGNKEADNPWCADSQRMGSFE